MFGPYLEENSVGAMGFAKKITTDENEAIKWFASTAGNEVAREWQNMYAYMYPAFYINGTRAKAEYIGSEQTTITKPNGTVVPRTKYKYKVTPQHMDLWNPYKDKVVTPKPPIVEVAEPFEDGMIISVEGIGYTESNLDVDTKAGRAIGTAKSATFQKVIDIALEKQLINSNQTEALHQYLEEHFRYGGIYDIVGFGVIGTKSITVYLDKNGTWEDFDGEHVLRYKEMKFKTEGQKPYTRHTVDDLIDVTML